MLIKINLTSSVKIHTVQDKNRSLTHQLGPSHDSEFTT